MNESNNKMCETNNNDICIMSNENLVSNGKMNKETKMETFVMDDRSKI